MSAGNLDESNARLVASSRVLAQEVGCEMVLLDLESEVYFGLDEVGTAIWKGLADGLDLEAVRTRLLVEFDVEAAQLDRDLHRWVSELLTAGLLKVEPS